MMQATYIYSRSCQCSCFSSGQGSQGHTPVRPSHPERREGTVSMQAHKTEVSTIAEASQTNNM